ncbi:MAG TPA: peptidylprolyl isomerase [Bacteroidales bacterium]|nr:peptidylprolyl isomerase [Bacteroidales bacterium]
MKKLIFLAVVAFAFMACNNSGSDQKKVLIETTYGDMKVKLYDETPKHRDNFVKLVKDGFYDSLLFHRVIDEFMIQGGDPDSKGADTAARLGNGGPGYKLDAEIKDGLYHKRGVLAAAREGDRVNPEKKSSGSQFYIVDGRKFTNEELDQLEERMNMQKKNEIFMEIIQQEEHADLRQAYDSIRQAKDREAFEKLVKERIEPLIQKEMEEQGEFAFSEKQRKVYTETGGAPHLDGAYTVFGEVYEGFDVLDSISAVQTKPGDRPAEDILMNMEMINE